MHKNTRSVQVDLKINTDIGAVDIKFYMFCNSFRRQFVKLVETRICKPDFRKECQHLLATSTKGRQTSGVSEVALEQKCKITSKATLVLMEAQCFFFGLKGFPM